MDTGGRPSLPRMSRANMNHRGTFVGTPLYVSPEMLVRDVSGPFTDLWALGVIVYFLVTKGAVPWKGNGQYQVFEEIKSRQIDFPEGIDPDVAHLIDKLMALNPLERLGMGPENTALDF